MSVRIVAAVAALALAGSASATGAGGREVGWWPHPYFVDAAPGAPVTQLPREFYPKGESAAHWSERVRIEAPVAAPAGGPPAYLDAFARARKQDCPTFSEYRIPVDAENRERIGLLMWHCSRNSADRGEVGVVEVLVGNANAYAIVAQGDYAPFAKGATPLTEGQMTRWAEFQRSFSVCDTWTDTGCGPDPATMMKAGTKPPADDEAADVRRAELRGRAMYLQDQLAWHGTDFALEHKAVKPTGKGAFIAVPNESGGGTLYFTNGAARRPKVQGAVAVDANGTWSVLPKPKALPDDVLPRHAALVKAKSGKFALCGERLNNLVLPAEEGGDWLVYLMTATVKPGEMWLGGHTRVRVSGDGSKVLSSEPSAKSCFAVDASMPENDGFRPAGVFATHLVSEVPWETHVFQSLTFGVPIIVVTSHAAWRVEEGKVTKLDIPGA